MTHVDDCSLLHDGPVCDCATGNELRRRAAEFFSKPENADVRFTPDEFMKMFDPDEDKQKA